MATKSQALIVPIAIDNTFECFEAVHGKLKSVNVTMSILKPIDSKNLTREEKSSLSEIIRNQISEELKSIINK
jgi:1-acyl-sn-glycerol-3-phosphate acyltransferase